MSNDTRKEMTVKVHGIEHTMLLDPEDAERYKAEEKTYAAMKSDVPSNKARSADAK